MWAVFGDIHGDLRALELFLSYCERRKDITDLFFTGDLFGTQTDAEPILVQREKQYCISEVLLSNHASKRPLMVEGNYDLFDEHFKEFNISHKKLINNAGFIVYGHGGCPLRPTDIIYLMPNYSDRYFAIADRKEDYRLLLEAHPADVILSHSPSRDYVYYFLQDNPDQNSIYLAGHTHAAQFRKITSDGDPSRKGVYMIKPGALGITFHGHTKEPMPQTFVIMNPLNPEKIKLITLKDGGFQENEYYPEQISLQQYKDSEGKWKHIHKNVR